MSRFNPASLQQAPSPSGSNVTSTEPVTPSPTDKLERELGQMRQQVDENRLLAQLSMDPDYSKIAGARQKGQQVHVLTDAEVQALRGSQMAPTQEPNFDEMTEGDKIKYLLSNVDRLAQAKAQELIAPVQQQVGGIQQVIQNEARNRANLEISKVAAKYEDFELRRGHLQQLSVENPSLSVEELYRLSHMRTGTEPVRKPNLETERPSSTSARPPLREVRKTPLPPGRQGFNQALQEALARSMADIPE